MNLLKVLKIKIILLFVSGISNAQYSYPVAICSNGILMCKYKTANDAKNPIPETISLADVQSIYALNAIYITKEKELRRMKVVDFQMTVHEKGDTTSIWGNSELLSAEMKNRLSRIKPGAKLYFEGIKAEYPDAVINTIILLSFIVN